jgi:ribosomal protein S18 acetylase RimI-like enzyme
VWIIRAVSQRDAAILDQYAAVPMYIETNSVVTCEPIDCGAGGFRLAEQVVDPPFRKVFPDTEDDPFPRHGRWDTSQWGVFVAEIDNRVVGGCVVALRTPQVYMLEDRTDIAVLWDIRVAAAAKRAGIGTELFRRARDYAKERDCKMLKIETQNVNASACHFYRKQGCHLGGMNTHAYKDYPEEVQLLWYLPL